MRSKAASQVQLAAARRDLVEAREAIDKASLRLWLSDKDDRLALQLESLSRYLGDDVKTLETEPASYLQQPAKHRERLDQVTQMLLRVDVLVSA
jgi:hypothetical protein